jgi:RNA ligase
MNLYDIMDAGRLTELLEGHYISRIVSPDGRFLIFDYTEKATFDRVWTPETTACRGLVVRARDGEIVGRAFDKFHNLNEYGIERASEAVVLARGGDYEVWDKLDGSMVLLWWADNEWRTSTRGSFTSTQARDALAWIRTEVNAWRLDPGYCYIGEWIGPSNRIVVRYPEDEWVLTGVRNLTTGEDLDRANVFAWSDRIGVRACSFAVARQFSEITQAQQDHTGIEGWVLRWPDGFRVKVKTVEYLNIHRLINHLTPTRIHESLCAGMYDTYARELPEEYREEAERMAAAIREAVAARLAVAEATFATLAPLLSEGRKAFALEAIKHPEVRPYLFLLADGRPVADKILKDWAPE